MNFPAQVERLNPAYGLSQAVGFVRPTVRCSQTLGFVRPAPAILHAIILFSTRPSREGSHCL
jgi:hypothetical protein